MRKITVLVVAIVLIFVFTSVAYGASDVFTAGEKALNDVVAFILKISTAAAIIGIGSGAMMKKFSMGNPQKIETGNKVITASLWGWALTNGAMLLLNTIQKYLV